MIQFLHFCRVPNAQEKGENWEKKVPKNPCQGKHRELGNLAKTQCKHKELCVLKVTQHAAQNLSAKSILHMKLNILKSPKLAQENLW